MLNKSIIDKCVQRGCERRFIETFQTRMELLPVKQTQAFLDVLGMSGHDDWKQSTGNHLKQWLVWLKILVEELPDHKEVDNWKTAIIMIENTVI